MTTTDELAYVLPFTTTEQQVARWSYSYLSRRYFKWLKEERSKEVRSEEKIASYRQALANLRRHFHSEIFPRFK